jgi:nitrite reductase/ring-hydroxylating ferredoxin subunit
LQSEISLVLASVLGAGLAVVLGLHGVAAWRERRLDLRKHSPDAEGFVEVCQVDRIPENRAQVISAGGERIAVFRHDGKISALSNVCAHQNGPLGEGKIVDGCVTCPWHGYQYLPDSGTSPPPFQEKVATFRVKVENGKVFVHPKPFPPGTPQPPARAEAGRELVTDEFYIGYEPQAPKQLAQRLRRVVACLGLAAVLLCVLLLSNQDTLAPSFFEFDKTRDFTGTVEEAPVPLLRVSRPNSPQFNSRYVLVAPGKHGAAEMLRGFHGTTVELRGKLVYRDGLTMIEIVPGTVQASRLPTPLLVEEEENLGIHTLRGEIVDSKCYFGVMNPGQGKVHRDCAVRCLSGGIPPALLVRHAAGHASLLMLEAAEGTIREFALQYAGETVSIRGTVLRSGDTLRLRTSADELHTLTTKVKR